MARLTGLEPATPGVTGRYSNQLSYNRPQHDQGRTPDVWRFYDGAARPSSAGWRKFQLSYAHPPAPKS